MLDYEGKRTHRFTVQVTDGVDQNGDDDIAIDDTLNVTVTVTNVNEAPVVTGDNDPSFQENDSSAVASYTAADPEGDKFTWSVDDPTNFWISERGQLYFRSPPSYEGQESYTVTVTATDDDENTALSGSFDVTVTVTDAEEEGTVFITPPRGWVDAQTRFRAELTDDDGVSGSITWQWARSSNRSSWADIKDANSSSYPAKTEDVDNYLRVTASYEDRRGSGKTASAMLTTPVGDTPPTQNNAPEFTETPPITRSVGQGTSAGRSIGAPVRATDPDPGDVLTYSLESGQGANKFDIDPATGQLRTKEVLDYDPQGQNEYTVVVVVHDGFDQSYSSPSTADDASITVTITVTAVAPRSSGGGGGGGGFGPSPTAPRFVDGFRTSRPLFENAQPGDAVGDPVAATHPNNSAITYSLSGADAALFTVDEETGQIRLEQAVTLALGQTYTVNLTATDSSGTGAIIIVVIEVAKARTHRYDANGNGVVEKDEVLAAIADYFEGRIEKGEVLELLTLYFAG